MNIKKEICKGIVFTTYQAKGIFEAYEIDYCQRKIGGYKIFPSYGQSNPYRTFDLDECILHNMRK